MSPQDVITTLGDIIVRIDRLLASPDFPDTDPNFRTVEDFKDALEDCQQSLLSAEFAVNSTAYARVTADLSASTVEVRGTIADIGKIGETIATLTKVVGFAQQLIALA